MPKQNWKRLADKLKDRQTELGLTQTQINSIGGPSPSIIGDLLEGKRENYAPGTPGKIDKGWRWMNGSARAVLYGGEPQPIETPRSGGHLELGARVMSSASRGSESDIPVGRGMQDRLLDATKDLGEVELAEVIGFVEGIKRRGDE